MPLHLPACTRGGCRGLRRGHDERVLALAARPGGVSPREVVEALGVSASTATRILSRLLEAGKLVTNGKRTKGLRYRTCEFFNQG